MKISEVMSRKVMTVSSTDTLQQAAQEMERHHVGSLPVLQDDWPVGMVTDRDLAIRGVGQGFSPETPVSKVMTHEVVYCYADQTTDEALRLMQANGVRRLVVIDTRRKIVGVVSLDDLIAWPRKRMSPGPAEPLYPKYPGETRWTR